MIFTGKFTFPSVGEVRGKITLDGTKSSLYVWSENNDFMKSPWYEEMWLGKLSEKEKIFFGWNLWRERMCQDFEVVKGTLDDLKKVSLINCLALSSSPHLAEKSVHKASFFPHYVVFGDQHISHEEEAVTGVSFILEDADILFHDPEVFGEVETSGESLNAGNARSLVEQTILSKKTDSDIPVGKSVLLYYTGSNCIFEMDTSSEKISAERNALNFKLHRTISGVKMDNEVSVMLKFDSPVTFAMAVDRASRVLQFLELLIGRSQNIIKFIIYKEPEQGFQVYGSGFPKYERSENGSKPSFSDILIKPAREPERFSHILRNWLERDKKRRFVRSWFFNYFAKSRPYDIPRIVLGSDIFNHLHDVPGSSGSPIEKISHCTKRIVEEIEDELRGLETVAERARVCRNYYVHAEYHEKDSIRADYDRNPGFRVFLTNTLEFIFVVSDLIESGWDVKTWWKTNGSSSYHPVGRYLRDYKENLEKWRHYLFEESTT